MHPDVVPRPRLVERLDDDRHGRFTLVSAPAGFGKTTLLAEWVAQSQRPVAWISLDEGENDPVNLLEYLVASLRTVDETIGAPVVELMRGAGPPEPKLALTYLINDIAERASNLTLVLDDYHLITAESIHDAVAFLVEHLPPCLDLVVTTRADPPLPLARWRARGKLHEVRAVDLRFAEDETAMFFNERMGLDLSATDLAALATRTEGWITGLQLAAISLRSHADASEFVREFAGDDRYVLDYLAEEVLQRQPEPVQQFLLRTSVLGRLGGALCDAVTGEGDGREMLERLEKANLFVTALDGKREWYRYHHLFADLLRYRLEAQEASLVPDLHCRASEWFEQEGLGNEAIHHALRAKDWERALRLVSAVAQPLVQRRQLGTLDGWLSSMPDEWLARNPYLCGSYAIALMRRSDWEAVERVLGLAEAVWQAGDHRNELSMIWSVRTYVAFARRDTARTEECAARSRELVADGMSLETLASLIARSHAHAITGRLADAERAFLETIEAAKAAGHVFAQNAMRACLGQARAARGRLRAAASAASELIAHETGYFPEHLGMAHVVLADLARESNDLDAAASHADAYFEIQTQEPPEGHWFLLFDRIRYVALLAWALGDRARAAETLDRGLELANWHRVLGAEQEVAAIRALLALRGGDLAAASEWATESGLGPDDEPTYEREFQYLTLARVLVAEGRAEPALPLLARMLSAARAGDRMRIAIEIDVLEALACQALGRADDATDAVERALLLAEPEGYVRVFLDEGAAMAELLGEVARARGGRPYLDMLVELFGPAVPAAADREADETGELPWWYRTDPLHKRELEVLGLVADGLSNDAIATKLFIAVSTVKRHVSNIYMKLDVHSRTQAVARARELRLLG